MLTIADDYEFAMLYFRAPPAAPLGPRGMLFFSVKYKEFINKSVNLVIGGYRTGNLYDRGSGAFGLRGK